MNKPSNENSSQTFQPSEQWEQIPKTEQTVSDPEALLESWQDGIQSAKRMQRIQWSAASVVVGSLLVVGVVMATQWKKPVRGGGQEVGPIASESETAPTPEYDVIEDESNPVQFATSDDVDQLLLRIKRLRRQVESEIEKETSQRLAVHRAQVSSNIELPELVGFVNRAELNSNSL